jgi:transcription termination factor Rho
MLSRAVSARELDSLHLADLRALGSEHGVADFRLLRRRQLIDALQETDTDELELLEPEAGVEDLDEDEAPDGEEPDDEEPDDEDVVAERAPTARDEPDEEAEEGGDGDLPTEEVRGVLELTRQRYGFLRLRELGPDPDDVYISAAQVRRCELRQGDEVVGPARNPRRGERHRALVHVDSVNGEEPVEEGRPAFDDLAPVLPDRRVPLDDARDDVLVRAVDLLAPLAFGQRVLVRAAARSGRTTLLRGVARAAAAADARVVVLLVDERPEEATAWRESLPVAEFAIATADFAPIEHVRIAELALERARRLAETGSDAVLVCDSLSRLAFAAGGVDEVKRLFGSGRNLAGEGSLTVVATTVDEAHDEGEAERAVITTESSLVVLDPHLAGLGVTPAIAPAECRVSNEEALRGASELEAARRLRSLLTDLAAREAADYLRERIESSDSNAALLASL